MAEASALQMAQMVAKRYEERVFCRFGVSEAIPHDQELEFESDFLRCFNRIVSQLHQATETYQPQANGTAGKLIQNLTRSVKLYVAEVGLRDWD